MPDQVPLYDPVVHTVEDGDPMVFVELFCTCGAVHRQRDPVSYVMPFLARWREQHAGDGHGTATKARCVAERERRREAAFVMVGRPQEYEPKRLDHLHVDDEPRPWPVLEV